MELVEFLQLRGSGGHGSNSITRESEMMVGFLKRDSGLASIIWSESVNAALCFGWIDGVRRRIDDVSYSIRFTPRRTGSIWSLVNTRRAGEPISLG